MRIQALCIAVLLIVAAVFCGCKVKENPAETDVYSRPLFNDASDKASERSHCRDHQRPPFAESCSGHRR